MNGQRDGLYVCTKLHIHSNVAMCSTARHQVSYLDHLSIGIAITSMFNNPYNLIYPKQMV